MDESLVWLRVRFISYAAAWGIFYSYTLLLTDSGVQTALVVSGLIPLAVSVYLFIRLIRRVQTFIGVLFMALVIVVAIILEY